MMQSDPGRSAPPSDPSSLLGDRGGRGGPLAGSVDRHEAVREQVAPLTALGRQVSGRCRPSGGDTTEDSQGNPSSPLVEIGKCRPAQLPAGQCARRGPPLAGFDASRGGARRRGQSQGAKAVLGPGVVPVSAASALAVATSAVQHGPWPRSRQLPQHCLDALRGCRAIDRGRSPRRRRH